MSDYNPPVLISAAVTMQRIQYAVSENHTHYIAGRFPAHKALRVVQKFDEKFGLNLTRQQRYKRRLKGESTFRLFIYPEEGSADLQWVILRTTGKHPALADDDWCDLRKDRLNFRGYELIQLAYTRHDTERQRKHDKPIKTGSWTWRMSDDYYNGFKKRIRSALNQIKRSQGNTQQYDQILYSMQRTPGFRAVRDQVWELRKYTNEQRRRLKMGEQKFPPLPGWMRARKCREYPLSFLVQQAAQGAASWFPD